MRIVVLDGGTTNPGDISWEPLARLGELTVYDNTAQEEAAARAEGAQALVLNRLKVTEKLLDSLPDLQFIGMLATGYNSIDTAAARRRGVTVCNVPDYCGNMVAQHAVSLLLCLCENIHQYSSLVRAGEWGGAVALNTGAHPLFELSGKTLGIVGFGSIGQKVAALGLSLGMKVLVHSRTKKTLPGNCKWAELPALFSESDVVSLHCPLTAETGHLVNRNLLSLMKPTAFLINTARGGVVDSAALAEALNAGKLAGAGLDVLEQEPPDPDDPLLSARNCVITPHVAWSSKEARERLVAAVGENLRCFLAGTPKNVVN